MSADKQLQIVRAHLEDVGDDLEMAELGASRGNRLAAFHLQQAAEKLVKAVRAHHALRLTPSHDIEDLVEGNEHRGIEPIPAGDKWRTRLLELARLGDYATTFRYPSPTVGKRKTVPVEQVNKDLEILRELHAQMRDDLLG